MRIIYHSFSNLILWQELQEDIIMPRRAASMCSFAGALHSYGIMYAFA